MSINVKDLVASVVLLAVAGIAWYGSASLVFDARVFPRMVAAILGLLAAAMLVRSLFGGGVAEVDDRPFFKSFPTFLVCLALIFGYIYTTSLLGYFTASAIFVPTFAVLLGLRRPIVIAASTVGFIIVVYLVFVEAFSRPLPVEFFLRP